MIRPLNGRNFEGWHGLFRPQDDAPTQAIPPSEIFRYEGDQIVWAGHSGRILLDRSFGDFSFRFEYLLPLGGRLKGAHGVLGLAEGDPYRIGPSERAGEVRCWLTDNQLTRVGDIVVFSYASGTIGRHVEERREDASRPVNQWNEVEIRCEGREITSFLNGRRVNRIEGDRDIICQPGLSSWDTDIRFRNVRIVPLAKAEPAPAGTRGG